MSNEKEAKITINGFELTDCEAMTVRFAIEALSLSLVKEDFVKFGDADKSKELEFNRNIFNTIPKIRKYIFRNDTISFIPASKFN